MKNCPQCSTSYEGTVTFCPRDGEVLEDTPAGEEMVGRVLDGQYEIESFIARGGMGALYRARHILLGDRVAIKTLRPEMRSNTEWLRRFQREGRAARRFRHPNAVTVYDLRTGADGLTYMVMEYVEGQSLDKELKRRGHLAPSEAWHILEPIMSALEAAHAQGVVHRDLKPENVMLNHTAAGEQQVKLLDLGIAKLHDVAETRMGDGGEALTVAGQILGTPYYMSPEQWGELPRDGSAEIDGRADIYSLGVIFYELITGAKPFVGYSLPELRQGHVSRSLPPLHEAVPGVPEEFARAIERSMAKDRADRPATAGIFAAEIRAALGLKSEIHTTANADRSDAAIAAAATLPGLESSQTLLRENGSATAAPRAHVETAPRHAAAQLATTTDVEEKSGAEYTPEAMPPPAAASLPAPPPRRAPVSGIMAGAFILLLLGVIAAGGWFAWSRWQAGRDARDVVAAAGEEAVAPPARVEVLDYWLEAFDDAAGATGRRVAAQALSLPSGQQFKFHFSPRERGYLYIIGPGAGNAPTTFLTARPVGILKTNQMASGADFNFPYGEGQVLELDKNPGTEEYVVIFSRAPLLAPAFLAAEAGHELTPAELKELEDLRARAKTALPVADVKESGASSSGGAAAAAVVTMAVNASAAAPGVPAEPVIFEIRIEHR